MAIALSFSTAKSDVISLLQASETSYATTVDGSNAQYSSDTEIANAILYADSEVCLDIIQTPSHPFQTLFEVTSSPISSGASLPSMMGVVLRVQCLNGQSALTPIAFSSSTDLVTFIGNGLVTGQAVYWTTTAGAIGGGFIANTLYYVITGSTDDTFYLAATPFDAYRGNHIDISVVSPGGTNTLNVSYVDGIQGKTADDVIQSQAVASVYENDLSQNGLLPIWFIEGKILYSAALFNKVLYTDFTLTASPQAPEQYLNTVVCGALAHLYKDGSDFELAQYYGQTYQGMRQMIRQGAMVIPAISQYILAA